jgi:glucosamine kinase
VLRCAEAGDAVAAAVLQREGEELGYLVRLVVRRLQKASASLGGSKLQALPALAFTGSIMERVAPVRESLIATVRAEFPEIETREGVIDPIVGAVWRARVRGVAD